MSCTITFQSTAAYKELANRLGNSSPRFAEIIAAVVNKHPRNGMTFNSWYEANYKKEPDFNKGSGKRIADAVLKYYNYLYPDVNQTVDESKLDNTFSTLGYTNVGARDEAFRVVSNSALAIYSEDTKNGALEIQGDKMIYLKSAVASDLDRLAIERLIQIRGLEYTNEDEFDALFDDVADEYYEEKDKSFAEFIDFLTKEFNSEYSTSQEANLLALIKEVNSPATADAFFELLLKRDDRINRIVKEYDSTKQQEETDADIEEAVEDSEKDSDELTPEDEESKDNSIADANNHMGTVADFRTHVKQNIRDYLDAIPKLSSVRRVNGLRDYDTDNYFGVPDTMNANEIMAVIYSYGNFTNVSTMIESIRKISEQLPSMSGLTVMADDLENDMDFAYDVYRTFAKAVVAKLEVVANKGDISTRISNRNTDKRTTLYFEYYNSAKYTVTGLDSQLTAKYSDEINRLIGTLKTFVSNGVNSTNQTSYLKLRQKLVESITYDLKRFCPTIDEFVISNYLIGQSITEDDINKTSVDSVKETIKRVSDLKNIIDNLAKSSEEVKENYQNCLDVLHDINAENRRIRNNKSIDMLLGINNKEEYKDTKDAFKEDYAKPIEAAIQQLVNALIDHTVVKTELNSRNVHGNLSSDVINNSMITNLMKILGNELALQKYGESRSKTQQYHLSNILVEHSDDKGKIVNYGLFRIENGAYVPTSYASKLLSAKLFNGAGDVNAGQNVLYSEMSKGDYTSTAFATFFKVDERTTTAIEKVPMANYFMRVPSDAPKTFTISAPRYNTGTVTSNNGFYIIANQAAANGYISAKTNAIINNKYHDDVLDNIDEDKKPKAKKKSFAEMIRDVTTLDGSSHSRKLDKYDGYVAIDGNRKPYDGQTVRVRYTYVDENGNNQYYYVQGTFESKDKVAKIINAKFIGFETTNDFDFETDVISALRDKFQAEGLANGKIARKVNTNHPIFKQLQNIFKQELLNASSTLSVFFKTDNGVVLKHQNGKNIGKPIFNAGYSTSVKSGRKLYDIYHTDRSGKLGEFVDGKLKLFGKVFTSDRFTVTDRKTGEVRNFGQEIIDESVDFLYGEAGDYVYTTVVNGITEVVLTPEQEGVMNDKLTQFVEAYITDSSDRIQASKQFIEPTGLFNADNITEFAMNYFVAYVGFNDLFEGDTKFYADSQTFLKRAKEAQGSGVPYGIIDVTGNFEMGDMEARTPIEGAPLNDITFGKGYTVKQYPRFKGVTIKNTVGHNTQTLDTLVNQLIKNGLSEADAKTLIYGPLEEDKKTGKMVRTKGFQKTKVNDAQSYITFDEWIRRIAARGQLKYYTPLIEAILDESQPVPAQLMKRFVQVQKNFYYDIHYNKELGVSAPRQIKNAEFVLVPRFIRGTELEKVAELMQKHEIDQLNTAETSKAGKANVLSLWDNNGNLTEANIKDFEDNVKSATEIYDYAYLYTQSETPQHMNSANKAAIQIMKKIVDNIPEGHKLYPYKTKFFDLYCANIKESYEELLDEFSIKMDEDGNITNVDYDIFFKKLAEEARRLGLDSNLLDYVTQQEKGSAQTIMPTFMSIVSTKLESIAQSLFNSRITRQTLPGYHAAQITNVGWKPFNNKVEGVTYDKPLHYHTDDKGNYSPYVEIKLPKSAFKFSRNSLLNKTDEELLKELQNAGLDLSIGYRIPTEGKQSVCVFKVVGFTDETLGSTIIVPDEWVAQTGSDFDIDSVYGITFESYIDKNGVICKIEFNDNPGIYDWFRYIEKVVGKRKEDKDVKSKINDAIAEVKEKLQENYKDAMDKEKEAYALLADDLRDKIRDAHHKAKKAKGANKKLNLTEDMAVAVTECLRFKMEYELDADEIQTIDNFISAANDLVDYLESQGDLYTEQSRNIISTAVSERQETFEELAKENGLKSYSEFIADKYLANNRKARNSGILDTMIKILSDTTSLEENLSRSNFDDIIDPRDKILEGSPIAKIRQNRSAYNFFDQAEYQDDVMSGAKLKGFSVTRDSFDSICNTVRPVIANNHAIRVIYHGNKAREEKLKAIFGENNVKPMGRGRILVKHNTIGWTQNNHNVAGKLLTSYSSQTTAHILDAVKEGAIPNVNDMTFGVYKLFPDVGADYNTAISFIMQPGITRIVNAYNSNKSIYASGNNNPVHTAIKEIARELGIKINGELVGPFSRINDVISALSKDDRVRSIMKSIYGTDKISLKQENISQLYIDAELLQNRLSSSPVEEMEDEDVDNFTNLVFDLGVVLQYHKLSELANSVTKYTRVCNPDKFGAKQTLFVTNDVFDTIQEILTQEEEESVLTVDGKPFLSAIYPNIEKGIDEYVTSEEGVSAYPPLNAFMKYATAPSIKVNTTLFLTQNSQFRAIVNGLAEFFSDNKGMRRKMTEKVYQNFQNYILNTIYSNLPIIRYSASYNHETGVWETNENITVFEEKARIFGYNVSGSGRFEVEDINNPTDEEIGEFNALTPAQKVAWIQSTFRNPGIFGKYKVNLFNQAKNNTQTISFNSDNENIEEIYREFNKAFFNSNVFVKAAALDLIKYAFVVEGFKMRRNGVSKSIANKVLLDTAGPNVGIISQIVDQVANIGTRFDLSRINEIRENFIRSQRTMPQITTVRKIDRKNNKPELVIKNDMIVLGSIGNIDKENPDRTLLTKYGICYEDKDGNLIPNRYVRIARDKKSDIILYKIVATDDNGSPLKYTYLYPLNNLEENEDAEFSSNPANNTKPARKYFEVIIDTMEESDKEFETRYNALQYAVNENKAELKKATKPKQENSNESLPFDVNTPEFSDIKAKIDEYFTKLDNEGVINTGKQLYIRSNVLIRYIKHFGGYNPSTGELRSSIQKITSNGKVRRIEIARVNPNKVNKELRKDEPKSLGNEYLDGIVQNAKDYGATNISDLYVVREFNPVQKEISDDQPTVRRSRVFENFTQISVKGIRSQVAATQNENAIKIASRIKNENIDINDINAVKENLGLLTQLNAEYVTNEVENLLDSINYFAEDEEGISHSINDDYSIDLIKKDIFARNKFMKVINDAHAMVNNYELIDGINIENEDFEYRKNIEKIRKEISRLRANVLINEAEQRFFDDYLSKLSDNPLVISGLTSILDGFHNASAIEAMINGMQETANPMLQLVTKVVMADVRKKEMLGKVRAKEFRAKVAEIQRKAKEKGLDVNLEHIFDFENGKIRQAYTDKLLEDMNAYRDAINKAIQDYGKGSEAHIRAKLAYDKWKLQNIHQPVKDDYYANKIEYVESMKYPGTDTFMPVYLEYEKLAAIRNELLSHITEDGALDDGIREQLKDINEQINELTSPTIYNPITGFFEAKKLPDDPTSPITDPYRKQVYNSIAAQALRDFLSKNRGNEAHFFKWESKFGFDEELKKNLDIVSSREIYDEFGHIIIPYTSLLEDDEYIRAKDWIENNAVIVIDPELETEIRNAYSKFKTGAKQGSLYRFATAHDAYDSRGMVDATKFTDDEIDTLMREELNKENITRSVAFSENKLISNKTPSRVIYKQQFYTSLTVTGVRNEEWVNKVNEINDLIRPYYSPYEGILRTSEMSFEELKQLRGLYDELADMKKYTETKNGKRAYRFFTRNVVAVYDEERFEAEKSRAIANYGEGTPEYRAWLDVNTELLLDEDGDFVVDNEGHVVVKPNHFIYGSIEPKEGNYKADGTPTKWVDKEKTDALNTLLDNTTTIKTPYYYAKLAEMRAKTKAEYDEWFKRNHIYNQNTHQIEPLPCWTKRIIRPKDLVSNPENYAPKWSQKEKIVDDWSIAKNAKGKPYYTPGYGNAYNYKTAPTEDDKVPDVLGYTLEPTYIGGGNYDANNELNEYEKELKEYIETTLRSLASTSKARKYFEKGNLPNKAKKPEHNKEFYTNEALKMLGWINAATGKELWFEDADVDYSKDREMNMPMTEQLGNKDTIKLKTVPRKQEGETDEDYQNRIADIVEFNKEAKEKNLEIHKSLLDHDYLGAIEEFIDRASHFNAVQDNKQLLFLAKNMLDKLEVYDTKIGWTDLHKDGANSTENNNVYVKRKDKSLQNQYTNWIRRLVYDQWKEPNNAFTRGANIMQSLTSSKFMMLNITGGIANVTLGRSQIHGESWAKEYWGHDTWHKGASIYRAGLSDYMANMWSETSTTKAGAIIKFMQCVDFDEHTGVVHAELDQGEILKRTRDLAFSPQTMGEHFMQNTAMFACMESHRIIAITDPATRREMIAGMPEYKFMNEAEYIRNTLALKIKELLGDAKYEEYKRFEASLKDDPNVTKDYAHFKKDPVAEFVKLYLNAEEQDKFIESRRKIESEAKEKFTQAPTVISQLALGKDGMMTFANDSIMSMMPQEDAYQLLGELKGRVIAINNKIHGIYDRLGSAQLEKYWFGGLVMQYHKHLYPGIMKRYRRQGYFNEERGTVEKGSFWSLVDFLSIPIDKVKGDPNLTDAEKQGLQGLQNCMKECVKFAFNWTTIRRHWNLLPEYERANIKRNLGDLIGWMSAVCLSIAARAMMDDDEDDKLYNITSALFLYEADRLATESFMYNPIGLTSEAKTLWSSPIAAQSEITDLLQAAGDVAGYLFGGEDYEPNYKSGIYAGENKIAVRIRRQIPVYRSVERVWNLDKSNRVYKIGNYSTGIVPVQDIADWINGK